MSFLTEIHSEIELEYDGAVQKTFMTAYYTIMSYLRFVDDGNGFSEKFLKERFNHRPEFKIILDKLISHSVLQKENNDTYRLNLEKNRYNSPAFDNSMFLSSKKNDQFVSGQARKFLYN